MEISLSSYAKVTGIQLAILQKTTGKQKPKKKKKPQLFSNIGQQAMQDWHPWERRNKYLWFLWLFDWRLISPGKGRAALHSGTHPACRSSTSLTPALFPPQGHTFSEHRSQGCSGTWSKLWGGASVAGFCPLVCVWLWVRGVPLAPQVHPYS